MITAKINLYVYIKAKVLVCLNGAGLLEVLKIFTLLLNFTTIGCATIDFPNTGRSPFMTNLEKNHGTNLAEPWFMKYLERLTFLNIYFVYMVGRF